MKVNGSASPTAAAGRGASRPVAGGFAPSAGAPAEDAAPAARASAASAVASLDALLALQETSTPLERRRRAVRRAGRILDALDELHLAVLDPEALDGVALQQLQGAVREARGDTEDAGLDALLEQIEIRAAVEMAKREMRPPA